MALEVDAERIRRALARRDGVDERRMFGGVCFFLNGHMLIIATKSGRLLVRVGKGNEPKALKRPGAKPVTMKGRPFGGFVFVDRDGYEDRKLAGWIQLAVRHV